MRDWNKVNELCFMAHVQDLHKKPGSVVILFSDGEVVYTKSGELFGQRHLHQFEMPLLQDPDEDRASGFVQSAFGHKCIFVNSSEDARLIRDEMRTVIFNG
jgi:hypothetical protein